MARFSSRSIFPRSASNSHGSHGRENGNLHLMVGNHWLAHPLQSPRSRWVDGAHGTWNLACFELCLLSSTT